MLKQCFSGGILWSCPWRSKGLSSCSYKYKQDSSSLPALPQVRLNDHDVNDVNKAILQVNFIKINFASYRLFNIRRAIARACLRTHLNYSRRAKNGTS